MSKYSQLFSRSEPLSQKPLVHRGHNGTIFNRIYKDNQTIKGSHRPYVLRGFPCISGVNSFVTNLSPLDHEVFSRGINRDNAQKGQGQACCVLWDAVSLPSVSKMGIITLTSNDRRDSRANCASMGSI